MPLSEAKKKAINKYHAANYEYIKVRLNKGEKEVLKAKADAEGLSMNEYIRKHTL